MDAVGVISQTNDDPLENQYAVEPYLWQPIASKSEFEMAFEFVSEQHRYVSTYLGAIVSADRQIIYWVNNTRPLP